MNVKTTIDINDSLTPQQMAQLQAFMLKLDPVITQPSVRKLRGIVRVEWITTQGTVVEAAAMWFPMLLGCWVHIDRTLETADISEVRVIMEET